MYIVKNMSVAAILELCCLSESSVRCYVDRFIQTGEVKPAEYQHGPPRLLGNGQQFVLLRILLQNPALYLSEIQSELLHKLHSYIYTVKSVMTCISSTC